MEVLRDSTAVTDSGSTIIPGPYVSPERTESLPLKGASTSSPNFVSRCCKNCLSFADDDGLKFIIVTFFILSAAVTVALVVQIYQGDFQVVPHGSVATDSRECSVVGSNILKENGNAVDAAVASTFCMGVVNPHITGLGGGGFLLVYDHRRKNVLQSLDFRESAPLASYLPAKGTIGPMTVGVPGFVRGLFAVHKEHGKLSWSKVVKPSADIARFGFPVPSSLVAARAQLSSRSGVNSLLHDLVDSLEAGQTLKLPLLANTLEIIANEGPDAFYNGSIAKDILAATYGSALSAKDLSSYQPMLREPLHGIFAGFNIIVPGAPSGGPLLLAALDSISALNLSHIVTEEPTPLLMYKLAQSIQQNYAGFFAESGDPDFSSASTPGAVSSIIPETVASHVAAVDLNDLYVSVVSGHNAVFGSQVLTNSGFVLNNALNSFDESSIGTTTASPIYTNAYPLPGNTNSTITFSKVAKLPEGGVILDHADSLIHPAEQSVPYFESSTGASQLPGNLNGKSASDQIPKQTSYYKRIKRFENSDGGPRAAIWGSSAANNGLIGGKRPISLATPVIAVEMDQTCGRRLILGGSDAGITAQVLSQLLVLDGNITSSIEAPRVRLSPSGSNLFLEQWYAVRLSSARLEQLSNLGLKMQPLSALNPSVNIVEKVGDALTSHSDSRGEGVASRF